MTVQLPDHDASKVKWALECYSGTFLSFLHVFIR